MVGDATPEPGIVAAVSVHRAGERSIWLLASSELSALPAVVWVQSLATVVHGDRLSTLWWALASLRPGGELVVDLPGEILRLGHALRLLEEAGADIVEARPGRVRTWA